MQQDYNSRQVRKTFYLQNNLLL